MTVQVTISVLDRCFAIDCEAEEWGPFLRILWDPALGSAAETGDESIRIWGSGPGWRLDYGDYAQASDDPWVIAAAIRNFVSIQGLRHSRDLISLHAGTVRSGREVLLLAGPSEAGKTTLLLDLAASGWETAGDDLAVVSPTGREIRTFAKPVHVRDPARWARFRDGWDPPAWVPEPRSSGLLPPSAVRMVAGSYRPTGLLFPRYDPKAEPVLEPLSSAEATAGCSVNSQRPGGADGAHVYAFSRLCEGLSAARITYPTSDDALGLIRHFMQDLGN